MNVSDFGPVAAALCICLFGVPSFARHVFRPPTATKKGAEPVRVVTDCNNSVTRAPYLNWRRFALPVLFGCPSDRILTIRFDTRKGSAPKFCFVGLVWEKYCYIFFELLFEY
jgi:hypothetical protein